MNGRSAPGGKVRLVTIDDRHAGQRLDNYLFTLLKGVPKSWVYRVLRRGEVRVNKGRSKPDRRLQHGDVVRVPPVRQAEQRSQRPPDRLLRTVEAAILYEDDSLLILDKPSGLAVHGGSGVSHGIIEVLRASRDANDFLELVHRLDRDTSGCLMVAKRRSALRDLQAQQRAQSIKKTYQALLFGRSRRDRWDVDLPLRKNTLRSGERIVKVAPDGKPARTAFRVIRRYRRSLLVDAELGTGRTHQIRVHAAASAGPILGDAKYGNDTSRQHAREMGLDRLFLHAGELVLRHPDSGKSLALKADLPEPLRNALDYEQHDTAL
jgi:23S rRNA pseudouridine955/2504/2580 synthase